MIEDINDIEIEKTYPCLICGKRTTGRVCSTACQNEWKRRNQNPPKKLPVETMGSQPTTIQQPQKFNPPDTRGHRTIKKKTFWTIIGFAIFICIILFASILVYSGKDYGTTIDINTSINVTPSKTNITNTYNNDYNHTINVYLDYKEIAEMIADEVLEIINNETD